MSRTVLQGDCLDVMATLEDGSIDAVVTDPPAGISFMGKAWDSDRGGRRQWVAWMTEVFTEVYRVMKPGAHGLVWALPRTSHWTAWALEDAGFEVRDKVLHLFGSGFPKSHDVSKAIDKAAGAEREVVGSKLGLPGYGARNGLGTYPQLNDDGWHGVGTEHGGLPITAPATDAAREWQGWGTALKPAYEDWWLIRKPLAGTVASNVLEYGTGALNVDGCRIGTELRETWPSGSANYKVSNPIDWRTNRSTVAGRWPANVVLSHGEGCREVGTKLVKGISGGTGNHDGSVYGARSNQGQPVKDYANADGTETVTAWECAPECAVAMLDAQSAPSVSKATSRGNGIGNGYGGSDAAWDTVRGHNDAGGPSRYFYCAKASPSERGTFNDHPTVKPLALMQWLVRLVTPPGGTVLDPFCGSGSTVIAADREGFDCIGIDSDPHAVEIAHRRLADNAGPLFAEVAG